MTTAGDMVKDVVGALRAADFVSGNGVEGVMQYLDGYAASGKDVDALLSWGRCVLPRSLMRRNFLDGIAHFVEFKSRGWLTDRMVCAGFKQAVHNCRYDLARDLFALFDKPVNPDDFAVEMAFFTKTHDFADFEGRIDLGLELGLFNFAGEVADEPSLALNYLVSNLGCYDDAEMVARIRLMVEKGLPADVIQSLPLRWVAYMSDDVECATFLVEHGAKVDAQGFGAIRYAVQMRNTKLGRYLIDMAGVDVADLKVLFDGQVDDSDWDAIERVESEATPEYPPVVVACK